MKRCENILNLISVSEVFLAKADAIRQNWCASIPSNSTLSKLEFKINADLDGFNSFSVKSRKFFKKIDLMFVVVFSTSHISSHFSKFLIWNTKKLMNNFHFLFEMLYNENLIIQQTIEAKIFQEMIVLEQGNVWLEAWTVTGNRALKE